MKTFALAAVLLAFTLPASAQNVPAKTQQFASQVAISDLFEVESSKLAQEKSSQSAIKDFARRMVEDHTKTANELKMVARDIKGLDLPTRLDADHQKKLDVLRSATGSQFDQQFRQAPIFLHWKRRSRAHPVLFFAQIFDQLLELRLQLSGNPH